MFTIMFTIFSPFQLSFKTIFYVLMPLYTKSESITHSLVAEKDPFSQPLLGKPM